MEITMLTRHKLQVGTESVVSDAEVDVVVREQSATGRNWCPSLVCVYCWNLKQNKVFVIHHCQRRRFIGLAVGELRSVNSRF